MLKDAYSKALDMFRSAATSGAETPTKLALSLSVGIYVAFSPFPGFHTIMILAIRWLFGLNLPILFASASVNNPWTMVPFYSLDYVFGYWLVHTLMGWNASLIIPLENVLGMGSVCVWSFIIGGNLLGIIAGLASYPVSKKIFERLASKKVQV